MILTAVPAPSDLSVDWRFVELAARALVETGLAARYAADPRAVLAEAGIELAAGQAAPALPAPLELTELSSVAALRADAFVDMCFSGIATGRAA